MAHRFFGLALALGQALFSSLFFLKAPNSLSFVATTSDKLLRPPPNRWNQLHGNRLETRVQNGIKQSSNL
jgi:hypothetical protein